jgi:hypothetical protein
MERRSAPEVSEACMALLQAKSAPFPMPRGNRKMWQKGVASAASFRKVRRLVLSMNFIDLSANIGLLI